MFRTCIDLRLECTWHSRGTSTSLFFMVAYYFQGSQNHNLCTRSLSAFGNILLGFKETSRHEE